MSTAFLRDWESSWITKPIRELAYHALRKGTFRVWSEALHEIGELEEKLFNFYLCEATLDEYVRTHGDWGEELLRVSKIELPGGD